MKAGPPRTAVFPPTWLPVYWCATLAAPPRSTRVLPIAQYEDLLQKASPPGRTFEPSGLASLAGGVVLFVVLAFGAIMGVRYLARARRRAGLDRTVMRSDEPQR